MPPETSLKAVLNGPFSFTARPEPVAGDLRMSWGTAILLLSLFRSRGKRSNFQKLQFLAHAVRIPQVRDDVRALIRGDLRPSDIPVRIEPWLNRAVAFAYALELVSVNKGKSVSLTVKGIDIANEIANNKDLLLEESTFLSEVAPKLTETLLTKVWRMKDLQ